jgi:alkylhydroperoxidase/carboxymuconolactone decarboxylase family protein YurZ
MIYEGSGALTLDLCADANLYFRRLLLWFEGDDVSGNPLDAYREFDPKVIGCFENLQELVFSEGALSQKFKVLIAMAIDAEHGAVQGATALGNRAIKLGATKDEIVEAARVAYYVGGNRALFTSATVLQDLFK